MVDGLRNPYRSARKQRFLMVKKSWQLYLFLLIPVAWVIVFSYVPMYSGLQIAFKQYSIRDGISGSPWIGVSNFEKFFSSYQFSRVLKNTIVLSLYSLVAGFPFPIILALGMNAMLNSKLKKTVQTITYIPHFISTVVLVGILLRVFNARIGIYGVLGMLFTGNYPADILGSASSFLHMYVWSGVWQNMGWGTIIYMAALSSVDPSLHEAAEIDGADRFKRVVHIDLPCILPTAIILLIMDAGHIMSVGFEKVYLMQNNLNLQMSEVISTYVYKVGIAAGGGDFPYATAIGLFNSFVNLTILLLVNSISRKVSATSLW